MDEFIRKKNNSWGYYVFTTPKLCFDLFTGFCSYVPLSTSEDLGNIISYTLHLKQLATKYTK